MRCPSRGPKSDLPYEGLEESGAGHLVFFELSLNAPTDLHVRVTYEAAPGLYDPVALIAGFAP